MRRSVLSSAVAASVAVSMTLSTVVAAPAFAQSSLPGATVSTVAPTTSAAATTAPTDAPATSATTTPADTTAPATTTPAPVGGSSGPQAMLAQGAGIGVAIGAAVMALYIGAIAMVPSARPVLLSILPAQMRADVEGMLARKGM